MKPATFYGWLLFACLLGSCADLDRNAPLRLDRDSDYLRAELAAVRDSLRQERADYMECLMREHGR